MITLAVQKSGRLNSQTDKLLKDCGISFINGSEKKLMASASNFPMQILYLRDDDIPECIADGAADIGIVGENILQEKGGNLEVAKKLGFAKCHMSIAVPKQMTYNSVKDLDGLSIATSYPKILQEFLDDNKVNASIHLISGSVEIAPGIGMADAIFDIVSTGSTLLSNGLKEVETVLHSEAVLVANPNLSDEKNQILDKLKFRIGAVKKARNYKYILLNTPNDKIEEICNILPGMKSPTIMPIAMQDWSSVHSVIREDDFWESIEKLKNAGAQGILVIPIEKMIV
jgi:ATP phosphoribosyltransferase